MLSDSQIQENKLKKIIQKLKQTQQLEKLASDESSPNASFGAQSVMQQMQEAELEKLAQKEQQQQQQMQRQESATQELLTKLRQPREQEVDLRPLMALASPSVGQRLLQATDKPSDFSQEERRLAKASEYEQTIAKLRGSGEKDLEKRYMKDRSVFEKAYDQAGGFGRGSKVQRDLKEQSNLLSDAMDMIHDKDVKGEPLTPQVARDLSQLMSRAISGGSPAIQLVESTIMKSLSGKAKEAWQYLTSNPSENYLGDNAYEALKVQFKRLYEQKLSHFGENVARQRNKIKTINPEFLDQFDEEYGDLYDMNNSGHAVYKRRGGYGSAVDREQTTPQFSDSDIQAELKRRGL